MTNIIDGLSEFQISALAEAGNIGSAHAAIALSQLIGHKIMVAVTKVQVMHLKDYFRLIGKSDSLLFGIYLKVLGDIQGAILLVFMREPALALADVLMNQKIGTTKVLGDMEQSALKEAGSILGATYLNALSELTKITAIPSVPKIVFDKADEVVKAVFESVGQKAGMIVGVETEFIEASTRIKGHFVFMPDENGLKVLLKGLGVAVKEGV